MVGKDDENKSGKAYLSNLTIDARNYGIRASNRKFAQLEVNNVKVTINGSATGRTAFYLSASDDLFMTNNKAWNGLNYGYIIADSTTRLHWDNNMTFGATGNIADSSTSSEVLSVTTSGITLTLVPTDAMFTLRVQGSGGAVDITANPQIQDATDKNILILHGSDDTNTLKFDDGTGLSLNGGSSCTLGKGDKLVLQRDSNDDLWYELYRTDN